MIFKKYDVILDKGYSQLELAVFLIFLEHCKPLFNQSSSPPLQAVLLSRMGR
jgi:hypothetical protein